MSDEDRMVRVQLNGKERRIPEGSSVRGMVEFLGLDPALLVVEHNRAILERGRYDEVRVEEGDRLELVHFVGGG